MNIKTTNVDYRIDSFVGFGDLIVTEIRCIDYVRKEQSTTTLRLSKKEHLKFIEELKEPIK